MIAKDGRVVWIHAEGRAVERDHLGRPTRFQGILIDATEQKEYEARIRAAEERYRTIVETVPGVAWSETVDTLTGEARMSYIGPQAERYFGWTAEELLAEAGHFERVLHPDDRERVMAYSREVDASGEEWHARYRIIARDGTIRVMDSYGAPQRDEEGSIVAWHGFAMAPRTWSTWSRQARRQWPRRPRASPRPPSPNTNTLSTPRPPELRQRPIPRGPSPARLPCPGARCLPCLRGTRLPGNEYNWPYAQVSASVDNVHEEGNPPMQISIQAPANIRPLPTGAIRRLTSLVLGSRPAGARRGLGLGGGREPAGTRPRVGWAGPPPDARLGAPRAPQRRARRHGRLDHHDRLRRLRRPAPSACSQRSRATSGPTWPSRSCAAPAAAPPGRPESGPALFDGTLAELPTGWESGHRRTAAPGSPARHTASGSPSRSSVARRHRVAPPAPRSAGRPGRPARSRRPRHTGIQHSTIVPPSGRGDSRSQPPANSARSRIVDTPKRSLVACRPPPRAVVLDAQQDAALEVAQVHPDLRGVRVLGDVHECLARDPIQHDALLGRRVPARHVVDDLAGEDVGVRTQVVADRGREALAVERRRTQLEQQRS